MKKQMKMESTDVREVRKEDSKEQQSSSRSCSEPELNDTESSSTQEDQESIFESSIQSEQEESSIEMVLNSILEEGAQAQIEKLIIFLFFEVDRKHVSSADFSQLIAQLVTRAIQSELKMGCVLHLIERSILAVFGSVDGVDIFYWLSVCRMIIELFTTDAFLSNAKEIARVGLANENLQSIISILFSVKELYLPFELVVMNEIVCEHLDESNAVVKFIQKVAVILMSIYTEIILHYNGCSSFKNCNFNSVQEMRCLMENHSISVELCQHIESQLQRTIQQKTTAQVIPRAARTRRDSVNIKLELLSVDLVMCQSHCGINPHISRSCERYVIEALQKQFKPC